MTTRNADPTEIAARMRHDSAGVDTAGWSFVSGVALADAERLLDWLEQHGVAVRECTLLPNGRLAIRWRQHRP